MKRLDAFSVVAAAELNHPDDLFLVINDEGVAYRVELERRTDVLCEIPWRHFGEANTLKLLSILEPVGERYVQHINEIAGDNWMPAARPRRR